MAWQDDLALVRARAEELMDLGRADGLAQWDQETMMPPEGVPWRARQQATLQGLAHERLCDPRVGEALLRLAERAADLDEVARAQVREMRRERDHAVALPNDFVRELAKATSEGVEIWRRARLEDRFADFAPALEHIVELKREEADFVGYQADRYEALLERYEPGLALADLDQLMAALIPALSAMVERWRARGPRDDEGSLAGPFEADGQWQAGRTVLELIGFRFGAGRLDRSTHPQATGLGPGDVRLTTRLRADSLDEMITSCLHEGGHGLYEQGIDPVLAETVIGQAASMGVHESQSRLWENMVGRGLPFWQFAFPRVQAIFPGLLAHVSVERFVRSLQRVQPGLIRVEADELTYNLHISLRYELERRLLSGDLRVRDLPAAWREAVQRSLALTPPSDREGALQDIHWAAGLFGYFPTYTLGNVYAAQLWQALRSAVPDLDDRLRAGETGVVLAWLREQIHRHGRLCGSAALIQRATGRPVSLAPLLEHLAGRYGV